jgi:hypothetical protein
MNRALPTVAVRIFKPGQDIVYNGWAYKVNYIHIADGRLYVHLVGLESPVEEHLIDVDPTIIDFESVRKKKNND